MAGMSKIGYRGKTYESEAPDTLELADRAILAINGLGGTIDPDLHYQMYFSVNYCSKTPFMKHHAADTTCDPKYGESFPMMRLMCGSDRYSDLEENHRDELLSRIQDGLYWNFIDPARPWRTTYNPAFDGIRRDEDLANVAGNDRMLRALVTWFELTRDPMIEKKIHELVGGLEKIAVHANGCSYYPDGGFGEPFNYPRSGWTRTEEAKSEVEGGEGSVTAYQGHQIQGLARWYLLSGDPKALELAGAITRYCTLPKFWGGLPDPDRKPEGVAGHIPSVIPDPACVSGSEQGHWYTHFHARAITLSGILEYGMAAGDWRLIEFVRRAYEYTLTFGIPRMGWINCYPAAVNRMEGCALGDLVALGIRLSDAGIGDYWDDVDSVVRNQLVEGQLVRADILQKVAEASGIHEPGHISGDEKVWPNQLTSENVIERSLGNSAGHSTPNSVPKPWVMQCCTGNGTQGLYYAWEGIVREADDVAQINLLLNRASRLLDIDSYLPHEGRLIIHNKRAWRISVRIPAWVERKSVRIALNGKGKPCEWVGNYLVLNELRPKATVDLLFPVRESTSRYTVNARMKDEQTYRCTFRGSTLVDISPRDDAPTSYPLYQRDHLRSEKAPLRRMKRFVPDKIIAR